MLKDELRSTFWDCWFHHEFGTKVGGMEWREGDNKETFPAFK
jgi:hypothetical protein